MAPIRNRIVSPPAGLIIRGIRRFVVTMMVSIATWNLGSIGSIASAQSNFADTPQTNLGPVGSPGMGGNAASGNYGTSIYGNGNSYAGPPNFAAPPLPGYGAAGNPAPLSGSLFDPYATGAAGQATMTPLGPPVPFGGSTAAGGFPPASGNSAYPNGGLLNGLFSGQLFSGGATSAPYQGAAFQGGGFGGGYGAGVSTAAPYDAGSIYGGPAPGYPGSGLPGGGYSGGNYGFPGATVAPPGMDPFPSSAYPSGSPSTLFPGGFSGSPASLFPSGFSDPSAISAYRALNGPRLRHTFISGGDGAQDVGYNQTDASIGFAFPNFLFSNRPLFVVPSFSIYLFDGPATPGNVFPDPPSTRQLPGSAYAAFLDFGWQTDPNQIVGAELGVRVGAYTDFDTFNSDSIRVLGKGLASFRLTPNSTLKAGVYYLDRLDVKLLPAGGLLWQPDPYTRFDIFFPEPKFAKYWRTIGTRDVWWYLAGEYGGDSWTVSDQRLASDGERVDINQINAMFGFEWGNSNLLRTGQRSGFIEAGLVFDRELIYEQSIGGNTGLDEAFIVRAGIGY